MRVSIVATSLDGQQPEAKSVINMVHRIQNRNPGYSDFSNIASTQHSNFSTNTALPISEGATALKLENEVQEKNLGISEENVSTNQLNDNMLENELKEEVLHLKEETENISDSGNSNTSNGLENFHIEEEAPDLFNSEETDKEENQFESFSNSESNDEEDDLEIPAFLRRQKN